MHEGDTQLRRERKKIGLQPKKDFLAVIRRSEEHTSELQSGYISYAVFCLKKKKVSSAPHLVRYQREHVTLREEDVGGRLFAEKFKDIVGVVVPHVHNDRHDFRRGQFFDDAE